MKRFIPVCLCAMALAALPVLRADAHVLKTDGSIDAIMHIDPDDDPIAGVQSGMFIDFQDKGNKLDLTKCGCTLTMSQGSTTLFSRNINTDIGVQTTQLWTAFAYAFPAKGVYSLAIEGSPLPGAPAFQSFKISYDIRVERDPPAPPKPTLLSIASMRSVHDAAAAALALGALWLIVRDARRRKRAY